MKDGFVLKQPNGLYCVVNRTINKILRYNLTAEKLIREYTCEATADIRTKIRTASDVKDEYADAILEAAATENERMKLKRIFTEMDAPPECDDYSHYSGCTVEIRFKTEYLKNSFVYALKQSVLSAERLKNSQAIILSETDTSITVCFGYKKYNKYFLPFVSCRYDDRKTCTKYTDTMNRNEYEFILNCSNPELAETIYKLVFDQFSIIDDFKQSKISVDRIGNSIIILFDIESNFYPIFTLIEREDK